MNHKVKSSLIAFLFLLLPALCSVSFAADPPATMEVHAVGIARIAEGNVAQAKEAATQHALDNAVLAAVRELAAPEQIARQLKSLTENVLRLGRGFIQDYQFEGEAGAENIYAVSIKATITRPPLEDSLRYAGFSVLAKTERRSVLVFLGGTDAMKSLLEEGFSRVLVPLGYAVEFASPGLVDPGLVSPQTWGDVGRQKKADYVILVSGRTSCTQGETGQSACSSTADFKLIDAVNRVLLVDTSAKEEGPVENLDRGRENMTRNLGDRLGRMLEENLKGAATTQQAAFSSYQVVLKGVTRYQQYEQIKETLSGKVPGVSEVYLSSAGALQFTLAVKFRGSLEELETRLLAQPIKNLQLVPVERREGTAAFEVRQKGGQ